MEKDCYENDIKNIDLILDIMLKKFDQLCKIENVLDQKVGIVIAVISTIIIFSTTFLREYLSTNVFTFGLILINVSLCLILFILNTKKHMYAPNEDVLYSEESLKSDNIDLKNQIIADIKEAFKHNLGINERKAKIYNLAIFLLIIGMIMIFINISLGI